MAALAFSSDGQYIFYALETGGFPVIVKALRDTPGNGIPIYSPGAGTSANVANVPSNPDKMLFYGNFGSGVQVVEHIISTGVNTNISPTGLTTKVANTLQVNPDDENQIVITVDTDQDLKYTSDGGTIWSNWNTALGMSVAALWLLWSGQYFLDRVFVGGNDGLDTDLLYSPNEGTNFTNRSSVALTAVANICNVEA